ncbi:MAG TPA: oligosaccharide flippase family protein [Candidatus Nanoarchaeia archaeon]|nr:oligosaccharide flippase family protein [Candidatus Nanoarchaeia archaeon]
MILAVQFLPTLKSFLLFPLIIKFLDTAAYGAYSQIVALFGFVSVLALLGLNVAIDRFFPGERDQRRVRNDFWLITIITLGNSVILALLLYSIRDLILQLFFRTFSYGFPFLLALIALPFSNLYQLFANSFIAFGRSRALTVIVFFRNCSELLLITAILIAGMGLDAVFGMALLSVFLTLVLAWWFVVQRLPFQVPVIPPQRLRTYLTTGLPLFFAHITYWIINSSDRLIIGYFLDLRSVGIYSGLYNVANLFIALASFTFFGSLPFLSYLWNRKQKQQIAPAFRTFFNYYWLLAIPAFFGMLIVGREALLFLSNTDFTAAFAVFPVLVLSILLYAGLSFYDYILILHQKSSTVLQWTSIAAVVNLIANLLLVPRLGILGAAMATFLTSVGYSLVIYSAAQKYTPLRQDYLHIAKIILASLTMFALALFAKQFVPISSIPMLVLYIFGGMVIYAVLAYSFQIHRGIEVRYLRMVFQR